MNNTSIFPASFKDPAGFIFLYEGIYYRQVNHSYAEDYDLLIGSGLYQRLVTQKKLIAHTEVTDIKADKNTWYKTLLPEQLSFISYPYEWGFEQLKDASLLTLNIQLEALKYGMSLKDATPFNIQWIEGKPVFIDTLSFEKYKENNPWIAYKQFCETFLAPLLLMHYRNNDLNKLLVNFPNGIPIPLTASLLPFKTKLNLPIFLHIHLHAKLQKRYKEDNPQRKSHLSTKQLINIINSLRNLIKKLSVPENKTNWNNYYDETILSKEYLSEKQKLVSDMLSLIRFKTAVDLGANTGEFSLMLCHKAEKVIAVDFDSACINNLYLHAKAKKITNLYPLVIDLSNPSPAIGWANEERNSFWQRINADLIMALALVHHLAISFNLNFSLIADLLSKKTTYLLIEFVPKNDPKVQQLLRHRKDVFENYTEEAFEKKFSAYFDITKKQIIETTSRVLYLMKRK
ncbi:MAG TPA: class I SAM-dependent methyltransferase [Chitinophagaceae bacterium]|nr:class I SAM-dependent methyltransferase [Chitinophagaceae bacterium]